MLDHKILILPNLIIYYAKKLRMKSMTFTTAA